MAAGVLSLLLENLIAMTPPMPAADALCHAGLVPQDRCARCSRIAAALAAIELGTKERDAAHGLLDVAHEERLAKRRAARAAKKAVASGA